MTLQIRGYAAQSTSASLAARRFGRRVPRVDDLVIGIPYCGICHSDLRQVCDEQHDSPYPLVPGHEITGRIAGISEAVNDFAVGGLIGVGCMVNSCRHRVVRSKGLEQYCAKYPTLTYNGRDCHDGLPTFGGYLECVVVSARFALRIPRGFDPKATAPLLYTKTMSYSPLHHWEISPSNRMAVVGLGGLSHMGLKFAGMLGVEVTLFTHLLGKEEEARRLGADQMILSTDPQRVVTITGRFDLILDTALHQHDLNPYLVVLKRDGTLVLVGLPEPLEPAVHGAQLVMGRRPIAGSAIDGIAEAQEMLDFYTTHGTACDTEMIETQQIDRAYERMLVSDVKYRFMTDMASLSKSF